MTDPEAHQQLAMLCDREVAAMLAEGERRGGPEFVQRTVDRNRLHDHAVCETSDGLALSPESVRRLVCQGRVTPVIVDTDGHALDAGRTIPHASRRQRRALRATYLCCAFFDCDVAFARCESLARTSDASRTNLTRHRCLRSAP